MENKSTLHRQIRPREMTLFKKIVDRLTDLFYYEVTLPIRRALLKETYKKLYS